MSAVSDLSLSPVLRERGPCTSVTTRQWGALGLSWKLPTTTRVLLESRGPTELCHGALPSQLLGELLKFMDSLPPPDCSLESQRRAASASPLGNPSGVPNYHAHR